MSQEVFLSWSNMTPEEVNERLDPNYKVKTESPAYLFESSAMWPSAIEAILPEIAFETDYYDSNFEDGYNGIPIAANLLRLNLDRTLKLIEKRSKLVFNDDDFKNEQKEYIQFVEFAEEKERITGKQCKVYVSRSFDYE